MTVCSRRSSSQTWFYDFKKEGLSRIKFNISLWNNILTLGSTTDLLSEHLRTEDLWELLFADDLAIMADCWDGKSFWKDTDWMLMTTRGYQVAISRAGYCKLWIESMKNYNEICCYRNMNYWDFDGRGICPQGEERNRMSNWTRDNLNFGFFLTNQNVSEL